MMTRILLTTILTILFAGPCQAMNALRSKAINSLCPKAKKRAELVVVKKVDGRKGFFTKENLESVLPRDLAASQNTNEVRDKIIRKSAESILKSDLVSGTSLFKAAKKVEEKTKMDVAVKGKKSPTGEEATEHKFNFDLQALNTKARIIYDGLVNSKVEYQAVNDSLTVSIEEPISANSRIALTHLKDREQSRQLLQYQLSW